VPVKVSVVRATVGVVGAEGVAALLHDAVARSATRTIADR
jgi:DNA-binding transcriptional regulator YbjK